MVKLSPKIKEIGGAILVQIHDEVVVEVPESEQETAAEIVKECMENPVPPGFISVPLSVKVSVGKSWGSAKELASSLPSSFSSSSSEVGLFSDDSGSLAIDV